MMTGDPRDVRTTAEDLTVEKRDGVIVILIGENSELHLTRAQVIALLSMLASAVSP